MTFDSLVNRGDYFSPHYLSEVLPKDLKSGLLSTWKKREEEAKRAREAATAEGAADSAAPSRAPDALPVTPRAGLRELRRPYFRARSFFAARQGQDDSGSVAAGGDDTDTYASPEWRERIHALNADVLRALGFDAKPDTLTVQRADAAHEVTVAHREKDLVALDCGWAAEPDDALDGDGPGRLLDPVVLDGQRTVATGAKLASFLFASEEPPRYVLLLTGGVVVLADRAAWGEGRYLAVSLDAALERNDTKTGGELDTIAALFGADSLRTPEEGGEVPLAELVGNSAKHAVGVSSELRDGLRQSVELIANEVLARITEQGVRPEQVKDLPELGRQLTRESLRYLYRILFLLYAEARPELGILPSDYPEYEQGYGLGRLGELVADRELVDEESRWGTYLYESLDLLFRKVQDGYRPRRTHGVPETGDAEGAGCETSEDVGLRFEPLHSKLFEAASIRLIGKHAVPDPRYDADAGRGTGGPEEARYLDTRLRNATLYQVLRNLMLTEGKKGRRGGFISYAQLGINQLGAVYEGLMSYSGFVANEELYEVAKNGDAKDGSWLVPASKADEYPDEVFVRGYDRDTGEKPRVRHAPGSFVYRLSGRDRQTSASYYTPESLTKVTVQLALQHRLDQDGETTPARELLEWQICEPALGSGAFLNEAINQVAAEYLRRRQKELRTTIDTEQYQIELQKVKAYIALHNCYGVDLNSTAVELAEVSLWLNTMHPGMEAPWFGLHLRRGNSLIGGRREVYAPERLKKGGWLGTTPERFPLADAQAGETLPTGAVHHFLLPAKEWGAVAAEKEAKSLAPEQAKALAAWRRAITKSPSAKQTARLQGLARRAEYLWGLVVRRLEISERDISRRIDVWGAEDGWLRRPQEAVQRDEVVADLEAVDTPYWRLKTLMDAWCALWFWPVQEAGLLNGKDERYSRGAAGGDAAEQSAAVLVSGGREAVADSGADSDEADGEVGQAGEDAADPDGVLMMWEEDALPGLDLGAEPQQMALTRESLERKRTGRRKEAIRERRTVTSLANLDSWLDFAESLLGTQDVPEDSLVSEFETLEELTPYEDQLPDLMGMDPAHWLEARYPWMSVVGDVADHQGFFHWELEYGQVFARGGYDLQVGNPPWVRPRWQEDLVLAESDPWFKLSNKPGVTEWRLRKNQLFEETDTHRTSFLEEIAKSTGAISFLGNSASYPLLAGTQPDLYRAFMCRAWHHSNPPGITGLIHPDTHFTGPREGVLRKSAYGHLRFHVHYANSLNIFPEILPTIEFGTHIYGAHKRAVDFIHMSWVLSPSVVIASLTDEGTTSPPAIKRGGSWDVRPHKARLITVNFELLSEWNHLTGTVNTPADQAALLYPVSHHEQGTISAFAKFHSRLAHFNPMISSGYHEKGAKEKGYIRWRTSDVEKLREVVLQAPHINVATPINKQPDIPCRSHLDYTPFDLTKLPTDAIPRTNYVRACSEQDFQDAQDTWHGKAYTEYPRLTWRRLIAFNGERSLYAALVPPGPAHVHTMHSMMLDDLRLTVLNAGFWASLPLDYLLRITGRSDLQVTEARKMPAPTLEHPLASPLLLRTLRLNCLTNDYSSIWATLFDSTWSGYESWAYKGWTKLPPITAKLTPRWDRSTPLRTEYERRAALVEIDALVAVWLGVSADDMQATYVARYPTLTNFEAEMYFDANGRKIARNHNTYGFGQTKETYPALLAHLEAPATTPPPEGYEAPFYKADREAEMRGAHAHFQARLDAEIAAGRWSPPEPADAADAASA
ncbi:DNA methyltransferase family protein [Streptomyces reniochalinae]|uniref:site-specific DNA-methyltransferase (adenine-specific) n=1 Tax=Streptomyces reniochalinae TaxID=2250578 RepID=A0A367E6R0_9ACTN|nr:class I SAM-dependent DNA methyltransferase [Streptomyces reniochalinae]RCG13472.1 class I SAM-dependent DNA methyltransferase [Streptomyces reniochalinae]